MKLNHTILSSAAAAGIILSVSGAFAQGVALEAKAEASTAEAPAAEATTTAEAPAAEEPAPAAEEPAKEEEEAAEEPAAEEAEPATAEDAAEAPAEEAAAEEAGGTPLLFVFADAWAGWQSQKSGTPGGGDVYATKGPGGTAESGFGLSWLGADLGYDGGKWAVNGSLRFGDALPIYGTGTLGPITNAYVTYRPAEGLSLDLGTFGTIYGAEVAESWKNLNYTRGELYFNMQPFWHTGLKAQYATGDFVARAMVVNDANRSNLGTGAINGGLQLGYDNGTVGAYAGVLQSLKPDTTVASGGFVDTFVDVVLLGTFGDLKIVGNFDMMAGYEAAAFWGASLAAGYQIVPAFGIAARGEYLATPDGFLGYGSTDGDESLATATLTLDMKPVPETENFVVRLDGRMEFASEEVYLNGDATDTTDMWTSVVLGVVGYADLL
jgi:hypothetical protein